MLECCFSLDYSPVSGSLIIFLILASKHPQTLSVATNLSGFMFICFEVEFAGLIIGLYLIPSLPFHSVLHTCKQPTHIAIMPPSMSVLPRKITLEPLTQDTFAPFGTVIENPTHIQDGNIQLPSNAVYANQGSAIKVLDVTQMTNYYNEAQSRLPGKAVMNMFICSPRKLRSKQSLSESVSVSSSTQTTPEDEHYFDVNIVERHPYTSQTFIPVSLDKNDASTCYLVIVAPTQETVSTQSPDPTNFLERARSSLSQFGSALTSTTAATATQTPPNRKGSGPPDLTKIRAFTARGDQAVTYGAGTWHAPMVVLGAKSVDFVVVQFANGVGEEDCQEMEIVPVAGETEGLAVAIDMSVLGGARDIKARL